MFHDEEGSFVAHLVEAASVAVTVVVFGFLGLEPRFPLLGCATPSHVYDGGCWEGWGGWGVGWGVDCGAF